MTHSSAEGIRPLVEGRPPRRYCYENRVIVLPEEPELAEYMLDEIAVEGWRLVSVDRGVAYFVRRVALPPLRPVRLLERPC